MKNRKKCLLIIFCLMFSMNLAFADLFINEVMTNPVEGGEYSFIYNGTKYTSDWIEIYNSGDEEVDLQGLYLSDICDLPNVTMWKIGFNSIGANTPMIVPAHGYKVIWCPGYFLGKTVDNEHVPIPPDKAPFKLSKGGEWIGLYEYNESTTSYDIIDGFYIPEVPVDLTYGSETDGDTAHRDYLSMPTPGGINSTVTNLPPIIDVKSYRGVDNSGDKTNYTLLVSENQAVRVKVKVTDLDSLDSYDIAEVKLHYRVSGGGFQQLKMNKASDPRDAEQGLYEVLIPGQAEGSVVEFYVTAKDEDDGESELWWSTLYNPGRDTPLGFRYPVGDVGTFETGIRLNEILASNGNCPEGENPDPAVLCTKGGVDNFNNSDDWIELFNIDNSPQQIINLYLTNNELDPARFPLTDAVGRSPNLDGSNRLEAKSHLLVWCDNEPEENQNNYVHANFTLNGKNDEVFLVAYKDEDDDGVPEVFRVMDLISWGPGEVRDNPDKWWLGPQNEDWSIGRYPENAIDAQWGSMEPSEGGTTVSGGENTGFAPFLNVLGWTPPAPVEGEPVTFKVKVLDDKPDFTVTLNYVEWDTGNEYSKEMLDNGENGDEEAGDGIFSASINVPGEDTPVVGKMQYYVVVNDSDGNMVRFPRLSAIKGLFHIGDLPNTSPGSGGTGHPVISELLASNRNCDCSRSCDCVEGEELPPGCALGGEDSFGDTDDWVEIYNPHKYPISLGKYYLSDRQDWTMRWRFPENALLGAGERIVVWCDGETDETSASEYHTNFFLDKGHDEVMLLYENPAGQRQIVDYVSFEDQIDDISFGRIEVAEGEDPLTAPIGLLMTPTPGEPNDILAAEADSILEQPDNPDGFCPGTRITVTGRELGETKNIFVVPPLHDTIFDEIIYKDTDHGPEVVWDWNHPIEVEGANWELQGEDLLLTLPSNLEDAPHRLCFLSGYNSSWHKGGVPVTYLTIEINSGACSGKPIFKRGDSNTDGNIDLADAIGILGYLFSSSALDCKDSGDTNDDGSIDLADAISILSYLFADGSAPEPPFPDCGADPTDADSLDCDFYQSCN